VHEEHFGTLDGHVTMCRIVVRRPGSSSAVGFHGATLARTGEVTILDGALGKLQRCSGDPGHEHAVVLLDPMEYAWAIPAKGNLFIPFDETGETTLADGWFARARIDFDENGRSQPGHSCVVFGQHSHGEDIRCDVHVGDSFGWGPHRAEIVRIISPGFPFTGWMEVSLH
jgi:hypothetical protein